MRFLNPSSWDDPFVDIYDQGKSVIDKSQELARDAIAMAEIVGDGVVDGAVWFGEGVVTAGEGTAKWSVTAAGDAVDWSKTSFAEVSDWTESAAGEVANFTVENYKVALAAIETGAKWAYEQLATYFSETLPALGGTGEAAREVAAYLFSEPVALGLVSLADTAGCVITFAIKLRAVASVTVGIYACGGGWGFFLDPGFDDLGGLIAGLLKSPSVGVAAEVTMVFGPVARASGARVIKLGLGMKANPANKVSANIGGAVLMEATMPPRFLGVRYAMELDVGLFGKKQVDDAGKLKWKIKSRVPRPNGEFIADAGGAAGEVVEIGWAELTGGLSTQATHFDAALRAHADPASADRIQATALAVAMSPFRPRYYGAVHTAAGLPVVGTSAGALGVDVAGDRGTVCIVAGLSDPTGVSFEAVGEPPLYWCATDNGGMKLVPYDETLDLRGATFRMIRGLAGRGVSLAIASDGTHDPRLLSHSQVLGDMVMPAPVLAAMRWSEQHGRASFKEEATFLLDAPAEQPEAAGSILRPGQFLRTGEARRAPNGMFSLLLADNGRLAMRRRGSSGLGSPTAWLIYEPGLIQDAVHLWAWASPVPAAAPAYHAIVTQDGRLAVRSGAAPSQAAATLWQSDAHGAPGPCFLAVTNQGVVSLVRGTPEAAGEMVWSSVLGAIYWPARRRQVVLRAPGGAFVQANAGGGTHQPEALIQAPAEPVRVGGTVVGGWEAFELQDLCTGQVALRAQGRRFVGVAEGGVALTCLKDHVGARELFTLEVVGDASARPQAVRLRAAATGKYVGVGQGDALVADREVGAATNFTLMEVEHDFTAHSGRLVHVVAQHSGKALEVPSGYDDDARGLVQGELLGAEHQKWALTHTGGGWFTLTNRHTGKSVDITGGQQTSGAIALQWPSHGGDNQRFALTPTGDGHCYLIARHSGQALDVEGATQASGGRVLQRPLHGGASQRWKVTLAPAGHSSPWTALGGGLASDPAIAYGAPGRVDIFARGPDDAMYQKAFDGEWHPWYWHDGGFLGDPSVVAPHAGRLDMFGRGKDNAIYQRHWDGDRWNVWGNLGGQSAGSPVALTPRAGRWDIFILGTDKAIWHRCYEGTWYAWMSLGGGLLDPPAALWRSDRYDLFSRGLDLSLYHKTWQHGAWSEWLGLGGVVTGPPTAVSTAPGCLDVFVRGTDAALWSRSFRAGAWSGWASLQGQLGGDPAAISAAEGRIDVLARGVDGALWHRRQTGAVWLPWARLGLQITGRPALASSAPGHVDVAVIGADKALWHYRLDG